MLPSDRRGKDRKPAVKAEDSDDDDSEVGDLLEQIKDGTEAMRYGNKDGYYILINPIISVEYNMKSFYLTGKSLPML